MELYYSNRGRLPYDSPAINHNKIKYKQGSIPKTNRSSLHSSAVSVAQVVASIYRQHLPLFPLRAKRLHYEEIAHSDFLDSYLRTAVSGWLERDRKILQVRRRLRVQTRRAQALESETLNPDASSS